jgi:hypothetical protein
MAAERSAVLFDWGGVMTGDLFGSFRAFCSTEGLDPDGLANLFRHDRDARALLIDFECGRIEEADFEPRLATALGVGWHEGLIDRLFAGAALDEAMVDGVRALRERGVPTGLVSNSWGTRRYPRDLLAELFDGVVISARRASASPTRACTSWARSGSAPSRPRACSSTTWPSTSTRPASSAWRSCTTRQPRARWPSWSGSWARRPRGVSLRCAASTASPRERSPPRRPAGPPGSASPR